LATRKGTTYVSAVFSHTRPVARPATTTSSWLIAKSAVPTISATAMVLRRLRAERQMRVASRQLDQVAGSAEPRVIAIR